MARLLSIVEDTFAIQGRGLIFVPGIIPIGDERFRVGDWLHFKRPDRSEFRWQIKGLELSTPPPENYGVHVMLAGLVKDDVPIGTEVWTVDSPPSADA